ncbi:acetyl esterase/lipase [Lachnotalea glycerini]|uniref:Acetyl esterase/lipase n=1 Tax=Lachnotalea glycerini TaxID=1763509 RepID=A0A318ER85_9FIRM|nr:alpha/beta hydrolase [Lachnotalea glycerini]PXV85297.1 acetyl esterase/lipase [Lachnotalea glycerini]
MINDTIEIEDNGFKAKLTTYIVDNTIDPEKTRPLVLVCPGGGYIGTASKEGEPIALKMNSFGLHACVLNYSCAPAQFPTSLNQLAKSVKLVRESAKKWHVDPEKIVVLGFSAGGHLAASLGTFWNKDFVLRELKVNQEEIKPNALVLSYPVITSGEFAHQDSFKNLLGDRVKDCNWRELLSLEKQVDETMPKSFVWHTFEDQAVPVENSLLLVNAMRKAKVAFSFHVFEKGHHGLALGTMETGEVVTEIQPWIRLAAEWILKNI